MSEEAEIYQPVVKPWNSKPPDYDMVDSEEDLRRWPCLRPVLQDCQVTVGVAFHEADFAAVRYQHRYRTLFVTVVFYVAILQLSLAFWDTPLWGIWGDRVAAAVSVVALLLGWHVYRSRKRLFERDKAEYYRLLKFNFLFHPQLWSGVRSEARQQRLRAELKPFEKWDEEALNRRVKMEEQVLEVASPRALASVDEAVLVDLIEYYREKRLDYQQRYLDRQASRRDSLERLTRVVPTVCFFLSIVTALLYFGYRLFFNSEQDTLSRMILILAAGFPVIGTAVRSFHTTQQFGRNALRFRRVSNELKLLASDLQEKDDLRAKLEVLYSAEKILQADRREWLFLMMEAERLN